MTLDRFRTIAALITITSLLWCADTHGRASVHERATFIAPDDSFRFSYPKGFKVCTKGNIEPCVESMIPACDLDALVCVVYPVNQFGDNSLDAEEFQVREIFALGEQMTANICATPYPRDHGTALLYPDFLISAKQPVEVIGGVQFIHGARDGLPPVPASTLSDIVRFTTKDALNLRLVRLAEIQISPILRQRH